MKSENSKPSRNNLVDIIRGLAMLMVILQHTISGSATEYQDTFLFKMIWSLQMPLFFIISGYVTRYSKPLTTAGALWGFVKKRSLAYLLPWLVWTIIVRGFIFQQSNMLDFKYLLWHMDAGYWFLVSLWTIALIFGFANYLAFKINLSSKLFSSLCQLLFVGFGALILMLIGYFAGFEFLDIKLTLFYIPLYACGFIFGQFQAEITKGRNQAILSWTYILCIGIWLYVITRYEIFGVEQTALTIIIRYVAALTGCVSIVAILNECNSLRGGGVTKSRSVVSGNICGTLPVFEPAHNESENGTDNNFRISERGCKLCSYCFIDDADYISDKEKSSIAEVVVLPIIYPTPPLQRLLKVIQYFGLQSLPTYLLHGFFLNLATPTTIDIQWPLPIVIILNFGLCLTLTYSTIKILTKLPLLHRVLFYK